VPLSQQDAALKHGWRSGLEDEIGEQLAEAGIAYRYEDLTIQYTQPLKPRRYTPDFELPNGIIIETKGRFVTADRQKHLLVKQQHPDLDIRFVFSNPNQRISKQSKTTYAMWCESKGFKYAKGRIPHQWLRERTNVKSLAAIRKLRKD
jgi:hypothetical protein